MKINCAEMEIVGWYEEVAKQHKKEQSPNNQFAEVNWKMCKGENKSSVIGKAV
jgi:hypothetical protein